MKANPSGSAIPKAVIDAGPIFTCLVANFNLRSIDLGLRSKYEAALKPPFQSETAQRDLLNAIGSIREKLTTSHAIGELQGLRISRGLKLTDSGRIDFWTASIDLLRRWRMDERLVLLLDLAADDTLGRVIGRIGPPDTGVIKLALDQNCVLITEDAKTLYSEAWSAGVECQLLEYLIPARP